MKMSNETILGLSVLGIAVVTTGVLGAMKLEDHRRMTEVISQAEHSTRNESKKEDLECARRVREAVKFADIFDLVQRFKTNPIRFEAETACMRVRLDSVRIELIDPSKGALGHRVMTAWGKASLYVSAEDAVKLDVGSERSFECMVNTESTAKQVVLTPCTLIASP